MLALALMGISPLRAQKPPAITGVSNAALGDFASVAVAVAPGELVSVFGDNLSDATTTICQKNGALPGSCADVTVTLNGQAAPLLYVASSQIIFQVPVELTLSSLTIRTTKQVGSQTLQFGSVPVSVTPAAPALLTTASGGVLIGAFANAFSAAITPANPAQPGDTVACLGYGFGTTNQVVPSFSTVTTSSPPIVVAPGHGCRSGYADTICGADRGWEIPNQIQSSDWAWSAATCPW